MVTQEEIQQQFWNGDPYLTFDGPVDDETPREFIPLIDTIRKESDWGKIFNIKKDRNGHHKPIIKKGKVFTFTAHITCEEYELRALETGKKCTYHPTSVYGLLLQGCTYDDFAMLSSDVIAYCDALILYERKELENSLIEIKKAFELKPQEPLYASLFFEIRLKLKDESSIKDELNYYENDIDSLIHMDRVYKWIRFLVLKKKKKEALELIQIINQLLDDLIQGRKQSKIYSPQNTNWYIYKKKEFNKKIEKARLKLESELTDNQ